MDDNPGRVGCSGGQAFRGELASGGREFEEVDAFALGLCGVGANVDEIVYSRGRVLGGKNGEREE